MTRRTTVHMSDRVEEIEQNEIPPRQSQIDAIREAAREEYDEAWKIPGELEQRYQRLKDEVETLEGEAKTLNHYAGEWGDDAFTLIELSVGGVGLIQDEVAEASGIDIQGNGTPKSGFARRKTLEVAIDDAPSEAPAMENIPDAIGDWLYNCIDEFNTTGSVDLGNSSLRADLMQSEN